MQLTEKEQRIFDILIEADGKPITAEKLSDVIYGEYWLGGERTIRVYICHIRRKLGQGAIVTRVGHGYVVGLVGNSNEGRENGSNHS